MRAALVALLLLVALVSCGKHSAGKAPTESPSSNGPAAPASADSPAARDGQEVARLLGMSAHNRTAAAALGAAMENGGSLATYLASSWPDGRMMPKIVENAPAQPHSVVLSYGPTDADTVKVEAFDDATDAPAFSQTVKLNRGR